MGAISNLLPLLILLTVVGIAAFIGYQIYLWTNEMADRGKRHMDKKHVSFSKDGMKVGVKQMNDEDYTDKTQNYLVKAWNYSSFPAYKSRLGWNSAPPAGSSNSSSGAAHSKQPSVTKSGSSSTGNGASGLNARAGVARHDSNPGAFPQ